MRKPGESKILDKFSRDLAVMKGAYEHEMARRAEVEEEHKRNEER